MCKVKGYTLVETLLSLTIIVISVGIGFTIFENFMQSSSGHKRINARNELDLFIFNNGFESNGKEENLNENISYKIEESEDWPECYRVEIEYIDHENQIAYQTIYIKKD